MEHLFNQIQHEVEQKRLQYENGNIYSLDALIYMREIKDFSEKLLLESKKFEDDYLQEIANEAEKYGFSYQGFEIKPVNGRKMFSFKGIEEIEEKENELKALKNYYQSAFDGIQKGIVQTSKEGNITYFIDENGELKKVPELSIGKSYLTFKLKK